MDLLDNKSRLISGFIPRNWLIALKSLEMIPTYFLDTNQNIRCYGFKAEIVYLSGIYVFENYTVLISSIEPELLDIVKTLFDNNQKGQLTHVKLKNGEINSPNYTDWRTDCIVTAETMSLKS